MIDLKQRRIWADRQVWSNRIDFVFLERVGDKIAYSTTVEMVVPEKENEGKVIIPTFSLDPSETQQLMDNLWQLGFRPTEGSGSAGALAATQKHLEDMRKIAFDMLEKNGHQ